MTSGSAPGKIILFGEHAVVYGRPALAVPISQVRAHATIEDIEGVPTGRIQLQAPQIQLSAWLDELPPEEPLARVTRLTLRALELDQPPAFRITVHSTIPIASGLGSGAAVSVAVVRAIAAHFGRRLSPGEQSALAFEVEKLHHGKPSGIDNTVVAYERPVYFVRGAEPEPFAIPTPLSLIIADTGLATPTAEAVMGVRRRWEADKQAYEDFFDQIAALVKQARRAIESGHTDCLGPLMDRNQELLAAIGVSSPELDRLITAARAAGASGAKLSGAGLGGNVIALVNPQDAEAVTHALRSAGASLVLRSVVGGPDHDIS